MPPKSAIPGVYFAIFGIYEPLLSITGLLGAVFNPEMAYNSQAPGGPEVHVLSPPAMVTLMQLAHTCGLLGIINIFVLSAARQHLIHPALQEKIVASLLTPLLFGDVAHLVMTFYGLGEYRWNMSEWTPLLWLTIVTGITLLVPRICWHLGVGRYVASRDGYVDRKL